MTDKLEGLFDKMTGIFVILFGLVYLLLAMDVITPKIAGLIIPVLVILVGLKIFTSDSSS